MWRKTEGERGAGRRRRQNEARVCSGCEHVLAILPAKGFFDLTRSCVSSLLCLLSCSFVFAGSGRRSVLAFWSGAARTS